MKGKTVLFAKFVAYTVGAAALAVCLILLPELAREEATGKPNPEHVYAFLAVAYIIAIPFFVALSQAIKLLHYIEKKDAFSQKSIKALQNIKICAIIFSILTATAATALLIITRIISPTEDVAPFVPIGAIPVFIAIVLAVFVAVLQKLLSEAISMKDENDLIV
jgi:hypothetical protein